MLLFRGTGYEVRLFRMILHVGDHGKMTVEVVVWTAFQRHLIFHVSRLLSAFLSGTPMSPQHLSLSLILTGKSVCLRSNLPWSRRDARRLLAGVMVLCSHLLFLQS